MKSFASHGPDRQRCLEIGATRIFRPTVGDDPDQITTGGGLYVAGELSHSTEALPDAFLLQLQPVERVIAEAIVTKLVKEGKLKSGYQLVLGELVRVREPQ